MEFINKILIKIIIFIIIFLYINNNIISKFKNFISYLSFLNEIKEFNHYLEICEKFKVIKKFKIIDDIKISIISPIYNRQRFIIRFLTSIQFQDFINIEIILVDDCSVDNTVYIIEDCKKKDERIRLIKNKNNKGTFVARNIGALYAKGKYIIFPDPDDILMNNIISFCYNTAENNNYEIIRFATYDGKKRLGYSKYVEKLGDKPVYFPLLSTNIFYGYGELKIIDLSINNKFIKTETYIKALNSLNNSYLNMYMIYLEDQLMNYILLTSAKSFYFSKKIGYYYLKNEMSMTKNKYKISKIRIKFIIFYLKIIFEYSKNTKYEKDMFNYLFTKLNNKFNIEHSLTVLSSKDYLYFYYYIINIYLNCRFITNENKYYFHYFKTIIENKFFSKTNSSKDNFIIK